MEKRATGKKKILQALDAVTDHANAGDQVLFFFSGHGTRVKTIYSEYKSSKFDEALVPCDINSGRFIRDAEIAWRLMWERGRFTEYFVSPGRQHRNVFERMGIVIV